MGWLLLHKDSLGSDFCPKSYLDQQLTYPPNQDNNTKGGRIIKSAKIGSTYYAAFQRYDKTSTSPILAVIILTRHRPRDKERLIFGYKDMDENWGVLQTTCPDSLLNLLDPTTNPAALEWRAACRHHNEMARRPKPKPGEIVIFAKPITFSNGSQGKTFTVIKRGNGTGLQGEDGRLYRIRGFSKQLYQIIKPIATCHGEP